MTWNASPVVITVAPIGAEVTRADNPALPHTPADVAPTRWPPKPQERP